MTTAVIVLLLAVIAFLAFKLYIKPVKKEPDQQVSFSLNLSKDNKTVPGVFGCSDELGKRLSEFATIFTAVFVVKAILHLHESKEVNSGDVIKAAFEEAQPKTASEFIYAGYISGLLIGKLKTVISEVSGDIMIASASSMSSQLTKEEREKIFKQAKQEAEKTKKADSAIRLTVRLVRQKAKEKGSYDPLLDALKAAFKGAGTGLQEDIDKGDDLPSTKDHVSDFGAALPEEPKAEEGKNN